MAAENFDSCGGMKPIKYDWSVAIYEAVETPPFLTAPVPNLILEPIVR